MIQQYQGRPRREWVRRACLRAARGFTQGQLERLLHDEWGCDVWGQSVPGDTQLEALSGLAARVLAGGTPDQGQESLCHVGLLFHYILITCHAGFPVTLF